MEVEATMNKENITMLAEWELSIRTELLDGIQRQIVNRQVIYTFNSIALYILFHFLLL